MDATFLEKLVAGFINIVKLPPRTLIIAILIGVIAFQFYDRMKADQRTDKELDDLKNRLDTCRSQSQNRDLFWTMKIDSIRVTYAEEQRIKNKELEDILNSQRRNNILVEKTLKQIK